MRAFVKVYHRRPSFVVIWFRGRTNPAVRDFVPRAQPADGARPVRGRPGPPAWSREGADGLHAELAVEVADRLFQIAFETRSRATRTSSTRASRW